MKIKRFLSVCPTARSILFPSPILARISQLSPQRSTNIEYEEEDKDPRVARRCHGVIEFSNLLLQILSNFSPFPSLFLSLSFQICPCESGGRPAPVTFLMTTAPIGATRDKSRVMRAEVNHGPLWGNPRVLSAGTRVMYYVIGGWRERERERGRAPVTETPHTSPLFFRFFSDIRVFIRLVPNSLPVIECLKSRKY